VELGKAFVRLLDKDSAARAICSLPTGCGKTIAALMLHEALGGRTLWLAHRDELITQPRDAARALMPKDHDIGVVKAEDNDYEARDLVIASVPTLARASRLDQISNEEFDLIVVDEAHHSAAPTYRRILDTFASVPALGITATPSRDDKKSLLECYPEGIAFKYSIRRAVDEGYLVRPVPHRITMPEFDPDSLARNKSGDFAIDALAKEMLTEAAVNATIEGIKYGWEQDRRIIVFCVTVTQAKLVAQRCNKLGMSAAYVSGDMPIETRRETLASHKAGSFSILTNFGVLTEGYDSPCVDCVLVARPTSNAELYVQMCGRGLRTRCSCGSLQQDPPCSCAKPDCLIIDLVGAHQAHGLTTADTLLEYAPEELIVPEERESTGGGATGEVEDVEESRLTAFLEAVSSAGDISRKLRSVHLRWSEVVRDQCYSLSAGREGSVHIETNGEGQWRAVFEPKQKALPAQAISDYINKDLALTVAERFILDYGDKWAYDCNAPWKRQPASPAQINALSRWRISIPSGRTLTKGEAGRLLDVAAAKARWRDRQRGKRKVCEQARLSVDI
jgi:superfamily II DNA or RNA helicase